MAPKKLLCMGEDKENGLTPDQRFRKVVQAKLEGVNPVNVLDVWAGIGDRTMEVLAPYFPAAMSGSIDDVKYFDFAAEVATAVFCATSVTHGNTDSVSRGRASLFLKGIPPRYSAALGRTESGRILGAVCVDLGLNHRDISNFVRDYGSLLEYFDP